MTALTWDKTGERLYESGVDRGVLFPFSSSAYQTGVAWNGLTNVSEKPSGGEPKPLYADNIKYLNLMTKEEFACTIEAFTYPDAFEACNGTKDIVAGVRAGQQDREQFGFSYRSGIGSDDKGTQYGYKIHLVYGCKASPSEVTHQTEADDPDVAPLSWDVTTTPVACKGLKPTSHIIIDSTKVDPDKLATFETKLYGGPEAEPTLPMPDELAALLGPGVSHLGA